MLLQSYENLNPGNKVCRYILRKASLLHHYNEKQVLLLFCQKGQTRNDTFTYCHADLQPWF